MSPQKQQLGMKNNIIDHMYKREVENFLIDYIALTITK
jgi:hypothetical protein